MRKIVISGALLLFCLTPALALEWPRLDSSLTYKEATVTVEGGAVICRWRDAGALSLQARDGRYFFSYALSDI
jgi:hypothetical protein